MKSVLVCLVLILALAQARVWMKLEEGRQRCFIEEVPKDTLIVGKFIMNLITRDEAGYAPSLENPPPGIGLKVIVTDPEGAILYARDSGVVPDTGVGMFAFTSILGGEHRMCVQTNTTKWFGSKSVYKVDLDIEVGTQANDYAQIAKQEHLSAIEVQVRRLNDRIRDIRAEQNYQRNREQVFRNTSESTNARVMWWSVIQTAILVATGLWQITHLKSFFKAKKLV